MNPPPWSNTGNGYIIVFKLKSEWVEKQGFLPDFLKGNFQGHFCSVMLVDYQTSGVGAYKELLFIPGKFNFQSQKFQSITKIYVSTELSQMGGIVNWAIPKEIADFKFESIDAQSESISVTSSEGVPIFSCKMQWKNWSFPVTTSLIPIHLIQKSTHKENTFLQTSPTAKGKANFAKMTDCQIHPDFFPDISQLTPWLTLRVQNFQMTFPAPKILSSS